MTNSHSVRARVALAATIALALIVPFGNAGAQELPDDPTGLVYSDNVRPITTLPNPGVIGARFRGDYMYATSVAGLTIYDISEPAAPTEVGRLALPHFENEDVDLGGDILLISNDAAESTGILYVIDISDPTAPAILSTTQMGGNPLFAGPGHTASCVLDCAFAWITDNAGIRVMDLRDPASPVSMGTFPTPAGGGLVTHDVQVDGDGLVWVAGFGGTAAYELPEGYDGTSLGTLVAKTNADGESTYLDELGLGDGSKYNDFIHHNSFRRAGDDVVFITEEDYSRPGCRGAGSFQAWRLPMEDRVDPETGETVRVITGEDLTPISQWTTELLADTASPAAVCSAHYFDIRSNVAAQGWYEQGLRLLDVSDPANIRQIGFLYTPTSANWAAYWAPTDPTGRILYSLEGGHGIDVVEFDRPAEGPLAEPSDDPGPDPEPDPDAKKCKEKDRAKGKKGCVPVGGPASARPSGSAGAPTVTAPVLPQWRTTPPAAAAADRRFGFACRLVLAS